MGKRGSYIEIGSILNVDMAALLPQDCFIARSHCLSDILSASQMLCMTFREISNWEGFIMERIFSDTARSRTSAGTEEQVALLPCSQRPIHSYRGRIPPVPV